MKKIIWNAFCDRFDILGGCVPLFAINEQGKVDQKPMGIDGRPVLKRSELCDAMILEVSDLLVEDWSSGSHLFDGMLYMIGWKRQDGFLPLYIGKAESLGKGEMNLSANLKNLHTDRTKFARWGDGYSYHIGDLSACVLPGHAERKKTIKYQSWANCLFLEGSSLREQVYFWATAWKPTQTGIWEEYGATPLAFLEYMLIGVAGHISPQLLNREGQSRHRAAPFANQTV